MIEIQAGRESRQDNDLFYTCSLIDYIARKTKNKRCTVVNALGKKRIEKIYELADIYHSDNIERVSDDFIEEAGLVQGNFDNVGECKYAIPTHWDIFMANPPQLKSFYHSRQKETIALYFPLWKKWGIFAFIFDTGKNPGFSIFRCMMYPVQK